MSSNAAKFTPLPSPVHGAPVILLNHRTSKGNYVYQRRLIGTLDLERSKEEPWPERTKIWCRHDSHPFDTIPIPIPCSADYRLKIYGVYGVFCSFACASAWLKERNFPDAPQQRAMLAEMAHDVFGFEGHIASAPPQDRLKVYGGDMTIEQFRAFSDSGARTFMRVPPFIQHYGVIEDHVPMPISPQENSSPSNSAIDNSAALLHPQHSAVRTVAMDSCEEDVVMEELTSTATGKVPPGGMFAEFIKKHKEQQASSSSSSGSSGSGNCSGQEDPPEPFASSPSSSSSEQVDGSSVAAVDANQPNGESQVVEMATASKPLTQPKEKQAARKKSESKRNVNPKSDRKKQSSGPAETKIADTLSPEATVVTEAAVDAVHEDAERHSQPAPKRTSPNAPNLMQFLRPPPSKRLKQDQKSK